MERCSLGLGGDQRRGNKRFYRCPRAPGLVGHIIKEGMPYMFNAHISDTSRVTYKVWKGPRGRKVGHSHQVGQGRKN